MKMVEGKVFFYRGVRFRVVSKEDIEVDRNITPPRGFAAYDDDPYRFYLDPDAGGEFNLDGGCSNCRGL